MKDTTDNLGLPFLLPNQAQKHVTVNEALKRLDATVQIVLSADAMNTPPETPATGMRVLIGEDPVGIFTGHAGDIAAFQDSSWLFVSPLRGWVAWFEDSSTLRVFDGAIWQSISTPSSSDMNEFERLGVNTAPDHNNHLAVRGNASLFTSSENDHRLSINKSEENDTASLILQSGFEDRAEIGLSGGDDLSVRISPDGNNWTTALDVSAETGITTAHGIRSGRVSVDTQSAERIPTPAAGGFVFLLIVSDTYPRTEYSGIFAYDTGLSPLIIPIALGPRATAQNGVELTGTTGPDDSMNVGVEDGMLVIENRYRIRRFFSYTFLG